MSQPTDEMPVETDVPLIVEGLLVEAEDAAFLGDDLVLAGELWMAAVELLRGGS